MLVCCFGRYSGKTSSKAFRHFYLGAQAQEFLAPGPVRRKAPEGWWKKAINPPKPKLKETVLEIGAPASHSQPARPGSTKGAKAGSKYDPH